MDPLDKRFENLEGAQRAGYLIGGFITKNITLEEREELDAWVLKDEANMQLFEDMTDERKVDEFLRWLASRDTELKLQETRKRLKFRKKQPSIRWWHYASAACLTGAIVLILLNWPRSKEQTPPLSKKEQPDILPGRLAAELRLPSGQIILLDEVRDTVIGPVVIKDGMIINAVASPDTAMHEIIIPKKGTYRVQLPDGTGVWLNAASSIKYPGAFGKDKREVTVTGETYFEVAKDPARPFVVNIGAVKVKALGTAFNINGFDEAITLTEGAVEVEKQEKKLIMKPGQTIAAGSWTYIETEIDAVTAWTRNEFRFSNTAIEEIMKQLARWYDCKIVYEANITHHFNGTIDRRVPVSKVLQLLEGTNQVHFTITDNTITVKK